MGKKKNKAKRKQAMRDAKAKNTGGAKTCLCEHVDAMDKTEAKKKVNKLKYEYFKCASCEDWNYEKMDSLLICMTCGHLGCPRSMKAHSLDHHKETNHPIFLNSEGELWCHLCDDFLSNRGFGKHKSFKQIQKVVNNFKSKVRQFENKLKKARHEAEKRQFEPVFVDQHVEQGTNEAPLVGLQNQGNTCYFNSIMQNLAEARCMRSAFASVEGPSGKMKKALSEFIEEMWTTNKKCITPKALLDIMASYNQHLAGRRQQDSYECFQSITRGLEAESAKKKQFQEKKAAKKLASDVISSWTGEDIVKWLQTYDVKTQSYVEEFELDEKPLLTGEELGEIVGMAKGQKKAAAAFFQSMGFAPKQKMWQNIKDAWHALKNFKCVFYLQKRDEYIQMQKILNGEDGLSEDEPESEGERFDDVNDYRPKEVLQHVFGGLLDSSVKCLNCEHVSRHYEKFYDVSLPIEPAIVEASQWGGRGKRKNKKKAKRTRKGKDKNKRANAFSALMDDEEDEEEMVENPNENQSKGEAVGLCGQAKLRGNCSVNDCLEAFTEPDLLFGDNAYRCIECTRRVYPDYEEGEREREMISGPAHVRYQIARPPRILAIHLKRFTNRGFRTQKCGKKVGYPFELDLAPYMSDSTKDLFTNTKYHLYGVSVHQGGMNGGHYIAYVHKRRNEGEENGWYYFSDSTVRPASHKSAMNAQAYMLFYEQVDGVDSWKSPEGAPEAVTTTAEDSTAGTRAGENSSLSSAAVPSAGFSVIADAVQGDHMSMINSFLQGEFLTAEGLETDVVSTPTMLSADVVDEISYPSLPSDSEWCPGTYEILEDSYIMGHVDPQKSDRESWYELELNEKVDVFKIVQFGDRIRGKMDDGWITLYKISTRKRFARRIDEFKDSVGDGRDEQELKCGAEDSEEKDVRPTGPEESV